MPQSTRQPHGDVCPHAPQLHQGKLWRGNICPQRRQHDPDVSECLS
ncbi:hypothetical protein [Streptomyces cacaoi]